MNARLAPPERRRRMRMRLWASGVLAALGALLLVLGSCSSATPPDSPTSANAGVIDGEAGTAASAPTSSAISSSVEDSGTTSGASSTDPTAASDPSTSQPSTSAPATTKPSTSAAASSTSKPAAPKTTAPNTSVTRIGPPVKGPILPKSEPTTLTIPAIGVTDSPVLNMSQSADGSIEVPPLDDTKSSGWYNGSPTPGEIGPSVLLGHVDSKVNGPSVFYKLGDLKPGDEIQVSRRDGTVATFKVDGVREYAKNEFPTQVVYGNLDHAGLRLITCGGTFNPSVGHYESNIVAFATLVS